MLGAAGVLFPELLKGAGLGGPAAATPWYEAGAFDYSIGSAKSLFGLQMLLFAWVEIRRLQDFRKPGSANQDPIFTNNKLPDGNEPGYPGGIFDPLGYSKGDLKSLKLKEIKNGRLVSFFFVWFFFSGRRARLRPRDPATRARSFRPLRPGRSKQRLSPSVRSCSHTLDPPNQQQSNQINNRP